MPLTPQDVHGKVFGPTRFRRGYDEAEVDGFLDEVEIELTRLHREIDALRAQLSAQGPRMQKDGASPMQPGTSTADDEIVDVTPVGDREPAASAVTASDSSPGSAASAAAAQPTGETTGSASIEQQVARTLVLAQRAADEAVRDAEQEAEQLRVLAQREADRLRAEAEEQAERSRREGEQARSAAEDEVEQLRSFEREYRTRLRAYLELQLRELDGADGAVQVEARERAALPGGPADGAEPTTGPGSGSPSTASSDAHVGPSAQDPLLTTELPESDPASVPPVEGLGQASSVPVSDYAPQSGVTGHGLGEEPFHEPRDLYDGQ